MIEEYAVKIALENLKKFALKIEKHEGGGSTVGWCQHGVEWWSFETW